MSRKTPSQTPRKNPMTTQPSAGSAREIPPNSWLCFGLSMVFLQIGNADTLMGIENADFLFGLGYGSFMTMWTVSSARRRTVTMKIEEPT